MKFDMTQPPPSAESLVLARQSALQRIADQDAREQQINRGGYALLALGAVLLFLLIQRGLISVEMVISIGVGLALSLGFFALVTIELTGLPFFFSPWPISLGLSLFVSAILSLELSSGLSGFFTSVELSTTLCSLFGGLTSMLVVVGLNCFYQCGIFWPRAEVQNTLDSLVELDASTLGGACIDYMTYVDQYPEIRSYQNAVVALGRKPVVGEYNAAKIWVDLFESRMREKAKSDLEEKACRRMTGCSE